jgi:AAA domain/Archaeal holliday junction resolvase (hjc)
VNDSDVRPTTHQGDLAKLPPALAPLIERPQWAVWRWTQSENGHWQKPPFMATQPERHASTKDASTWSDYATALAVLRTGKADGISYVLTEDDPFAAIDLDHCRDIDTCSIDVWAQNFLEAGRASYSEVTPSGAGCRIWGLADGAMLNKKFTLNIDGKDVAAELFRRTNKALTITGYRLDTITKLTNIDRVIDWAVIWGERRKAAAAEAAVPINGNGFNGNGGGYGIDQIEQIVRTGVPDGKNRSDVFHTIVGHYLGCGWSAEQILEHLQQFPDGMGSRYLREDRLGNEIARSAGKYAKPELPLFGNGGGWVNGFAAKAPQSEIPRQEEPKRPEPEQPSPEPEDDPDLDDDLDEGDPPELGDDLDDKLPRQDPELPPLYAHGDADPRPLKSWAVKHFIPRCGHGLLSGQWGTGKTFIVFDLAAALGTGQPFPGHAVKRQCGVLLIAAEGADEVRLRLDAVVRAKCGGMARAPFRWYETAPMLLHKGSIETLIAMAQQAEASLQQEFGLPLGLIVIDTIAACAGYTKTGDENDNAVGQAIMNVLKTVAQTLNCFVITSARISKPARVAPTAGKVPVTLCWRAWVRRNSAAASPIQCWRCASIAVARNIPSRCASSTADPCGEPVVARQGCSRFARARRSKPPGGRMSGRRSRSKGARTERSIVSALQAKGIAAVRVPLSGAVGGRFGGDIVLPLIGRDLCVEVKARADGFRELYRWLNQREVLIVKADRQEPLVVVRLSLAAEIAKGTAK